MVGNCSNPEIISLTQKTLPKKVSSKSAAAKIRHKTNDLFHSYLLFMVSNLLASIEYPLTS
jgi:hypothetical protein